MTGLNRCWTPPVAASPAAGFALAGGTDGAETRAVSAGVAMTLPAPSAEPGADCSELQSGKIYLYNLGIFAWVVLLAFVGLWFLV